jgi:predicted Zn finger-like uncharacterized protein
MLLVCPNCSTSYQVGAPAIGERGRSVRCARCRTIWFAELPAEEPAGRVSESVADEAVTAFRAELGAAADPPARDQSPAPPTAGAAVAGKQAEKATEPVASPPLADPTSPGAGAEDARAPAAAGAEPAAEGAPLAPGSEVGPPGERPAIENNREDIESAAVRRRAGVQTRRRSQKRKPTLPVAITVLALVCAGLLIWRKDAVRHLPQLASFYASIGLPVNLRGLDFTELKTARETHDGIPVLVVEGTIVSAVSVPVEVPRLRFALRNAAGAEVYVWTAQPTQSDLQSTEKLPFRSRLASPPDDGSDVEVRFFTRRDAVVGSH